MKTLNVTSAITCSHASRILVRRFDFMCARSFHLILALSVIFGATASADGSQAKDADCLSPVDPYPGDWHVRYTDQLRKKIEPPLHTFAEMLIRPAFEPKYSVSLHGTPNDLEFAQAIKFFLSYYAADKNIWYSTPENNEEKQQKDVSVSVTTVEFPNPLAKRIYEVWRHMLLRARYFEDTGIRPDAIMTEFSPAGMYGETYDPSGSESAAYLIELGHRLIDYCKAPPEKRALAVKSIEMQAKWLDRYLRTHPTK